MTRRLAVFLAPILLLSSAAGVIAAEPADRLVRPIEDEVIYFVLPDRFANGDPGNDTGGIAGGRLDHGYDPEDKGFYHGGDFKGLIGKLDYLEGLGVSAIWLAPIFANKPVQGPPGMESAAYHGYWITDFTRPDPHFGTEEEFRALVEAAHARGMRVIMDIVTNHSADVIEYEECRAAGKRWNCPYRPLTEPPYSPVVPADEADIKVPAWLNDPRHYHNRGDSTFEGESSLYGDFAGLDDIDTESPEVIAGMIAIYRDWISRYHIDGFRIDTARHVSDEFWRAFLPAILDHARSEGIPNFYIFGEVFDPDVTQLSRYVREAGFPAVLDFAFEDRARAVIAEGAPTRLLADLYAEDRAYGEDGATARRLPVFLGNHDMGRIGHFITRANPWASDSEKLARSRLAHALMLFARGVPVLYYGDEQGFTGDGGDRDAREDMFESRTRVYNDNDLIGSDATTAEDNFDPDHPLYREISAMLAVRRAEPGLRRGRQRVLHAEDEAGLFLFLREDDAARYLVAINSAGRERAAEIVLKGDFKRLIGDGATRITAADGKLALTLPPFGFAVWRAE
ncbi:MAG: alpha-amylase family glycosyl hydrolase [Rhodothalassiaceae bacterium]